MHSPLPESLDEGTRDHNFGDRFVGEVDLPECTRSAFGRFALAHAVTGEEPLLKADKRRFVLFPIKYHEVCT